MRVEYKYLVNHWKMQHLMHYFDSMLHKDPHYDSEPYGVCSVYYDTLGLEYYHEKIEGEYFHKKARLRTYGDHPLQGDTYFEVKYKYHDDGFKKRIKITDTKYQALPLMDIGFAMQSYDSQMEQILGEDLIFPVCCVHYKRRAYSLQLHGMSIRINIDHHIRVVSEGGRSEYSDEIFPEGHGIVEVKSLHRRSFPHLAEILKEVGEPRTTFSKYISAMNVLYSQYKMETPYEF